MEREGTTNIPASCGKSTPHLSLPTQPPLPTMYISFRAVQVYIIHPFYPLRTYPTIYTSPPYSAYKATAQPSSA